MEEATSENCELLLTDYLLNFEEESVKECSYDGNCSSGVECSDNELNDELDICSLASLKEIIQKDSGGEFPVVTEKRNTRSKGASVKKKTDLSHLTVTEEDRDVHRKERDRARAVNYRVRKAQKIKEMEEECRELRENNKLLSKKNTTMTDKISDLEEQVEYLKSIIANESALSAILNTLTKDSGMEFTRNSLQLKPVAASKKRKRHDSVDINDEGNTKKKNSSSSPGTSGGVCVHVAPGRMSLEFCKECQKNSTKE